MTLPRHGYLLLASICVSACAGSPPLGPPAAPAAIEAQVLATPDNTSTAKLWQDANDVLAARCVVCHGCYDAPCQLILSAPEGVERGASKIEVYEASRLIAIEPTRLFIDADNEADWRKKGFHSVLSRAPGEDPARGLLLRMLDLKREHPLVTNSRVLPKEYTLGLDREQSCTDAADFGEFSEKHPSWGMPYALPSLNEAEEVALRRWVMAGAPKPEKPDNPPALMRAIQNWEAMLNGESLKERLVARYLYEHLFLGHLYFEDVKDDKDANSQVFFRLVRSRTDPGKPVEEIATRRPFDDPKGAFFYRFKRLDETILSKTHMPYALSAQRLEWIRKVFLEPEYEVSEFPSYDAEVASNPFLAFRELPAQARYRFMLEEARFTIMGFIKGPVCRGQVALDVIRDRFWMVFIDPDSPFVAADAAFLASESKNLAMPASDGATANLVSWLKYSKAQDKWLKAKSRYIKEHTKGTAPLTLDAIWSGDGHNPNAALTVFRHFDSASVVHGLVGEHPITSWVIDYPLLERIHYLLVSGFDVFGNVGHQLNTRMYMDFLRMEGEHNYLRFLPTPKRRALVEHWYRNVDDDDVKDQVYGQMARFEQNTGITFHTATPQHELPELLKTHLTKVRSKEYDLGEELPAPLRDTLAKLAAIDGLAANQQSELSFIEVRDTSKNLYLTLMRDSAHSNVAELFEEDDRRLPKEDRLSLVRGFLGSYPNTLFSVSRAELDEFVTLLEAAQDDEHYAALCARFCVRRSHAQIWPLIDRMTQAAREQAPIDFGRFDLNRLENR